jgi:glycosyltransferase involved in cell wall biosynthesis
MLLTNAFEPDPRVHQEAISLIAAGYDVSILCWDRDLKAPCSEVIDGINIERIHVRSTHGRGSIQIFFLFLFWFKALTWAHSKSFHVLHCHDFDTLPIGYLLSRLISAKLIYDAHENYADMLENVPPWLKSVIRTVENRILKHVDLLITVGKTLEEDFQSRGAVRTCVVGNWKNSEDFSFPESRINHEKSKLGIRRGQLTVSFIGNLGLERQLIPLIEAIKRSPDCFLLVGGRGPSEQIAQQAAKEYPNIAYLGFVDPPKVSFYTTMSDVLYYGFDPQNRNSRFSAPNKLFEAIAAGKAVLTGNFGEIGKLTREFRLGYILPSYTKEHIETALRFFLTQDRTEQIRNNARAALKKYNWVLAQKMLLDAYNSLCSSSHLQD